MRSLTTLASRGPEATETSVARFANQKCADHKIWGDIAHIGDRPGSALPSAGVVGAIRCLYQMTFPRITVEADKMGGQPCIRGLRIPVATVVAMVADGMTVDEILSDLPNLEAEDIAEALRYAAEAVRERELPIRQPM